MRAFVALSAMLLLGCGSNAMSRGPRDSHIPGGDPTKPQGPARKPRGNGDLPPTVAEMPAQRTICRGKSIPRGYVAIDYGNSSDCAIVGDSSHVYNAVIVLDLYGKPVGTVLWMCSDQRVPSGWHATSRREATGQCRKSPNDKATTDQTIEIMKSG